MSALIRPWYWSYWVIIMYFTKLLYLACVGWPDINWVMQADSKNIVAWPVYKVKIEVILKLWSIKNFKWRFWNIAHTWRIALLQLDCEFLLATSDELANSTQPLDLVDIILIINHTALFAHFLTIPEDIAVLPVVPSLVLSLSNFWLESFQIRLNGSWKSSISIRYIDF